MGGPVVGWLAVPLGIKGGLAPDVPVTVRVVPGAAGLLKPFVLITGVVDNEVENELHSALVELIHEEVDFLDAAIARVYDAVVADIIALSYDA